MYTLLYLLIYGYNSSSLLHADFLCCRDQGLRSSCNAQGSHCSSFSCCRAQVLGAWASVLVAQGLSSWAKGFRVQAQ